MERKLKDLKASPELKSADIKTKLIHTICWKAVETQTRRFRTSSDLFRETRKKERMEKELKDLKASLELKSADIKTKQGSIALGQEQISKLEHMLKEQKSATEKGQKELDGMNQKVSVRNCASRPSHQ